MPPIVHHAPGTDPENPPAAQKNVAGPIVHKEPTKADDDVAVVHHGMPIAELFDKLEAEAKSRDAARRVANAADAKVAPDAKPAVEAEAAQ